jgi:hypothetical protein
MPENKVESNLSQEKLLSGFLVFSLLLNVFLVFNANSLNGQITTLSNTVSTLSQSLGSSKIQTSGTSAATQNSGETLKIRIVNDQKCKNCDTTALVQNLKTAFGNPMIIEYDVGSATGQQLFANSGVKYLPLVLFENNVTKSQYISSVSQYLKPAGDYLSLAIGASYDPLCYKSDGSADCTKCSTLSDCRDLKPNQVDLFIMSHCPYGVQATDAMKEVLNTLKGVTLNIHYIADYDSSTKQFNSLHGAEEVNEDIRELCAKEISPSTYLNYIWCRNSNIASTAWESCATNSSIDVAKLKACSEGDDGKTLLMNDIKIGQELKVDASPTFYANNRYTFQGLAANDIKTGICKYNPTLVGCSQTLSTASAAPSGAGCTTPT